MTDYKEKYEKLLKDTYHFIGKTVGMRAASKCEEMDLLKVLEEENFKFCGLTDVGVENMKFYMRIAKEYYYNETKEAKWDVIKNHVFTAEKISERDNEVVLKVSNAYNCDNIKKGDTVLMPKYLYDSAALAVYSEHTGLENNPEGTLEGKILFNEYNITAIKKEEPIEE